MINKLKLNKNFIGDGYPCYYTLEIGPTHNGFESAKSLIEKSANVGANAVKLQLIKPNAIIADKNYSIDFKVLSKKTGKLIKKKKKLYDIFKERYLDYDEIRELNKISKKSKLDFFLTVTDEQDLDFIKELRCPSIKIASSDVNYIQLIAKAAKLNLPIQLDTGNSTISEIKRAVKTIKSQKNSKIIIHYCPTGYPSEKASLNLNYIKFLKQKFKVPIGFSDHTIDNKYCHLALLFGANLIEKTVSENIYSKKIEHSMSTNISQVNNFISSLKETELQINKKMFFLTTAEIKKRIKHRRSAYTIKPMIKNQRLLLKDLVFKRPGYGIQPDRIKKYLGKRLKKNLEKNSLIKDFYLKK